MPTDSAGESAAPHETRPDSVARDEDQHRAPVKLGAWQAYLIKVLPPIPEQARTDISGL